MFAISVELGCPPLPAMVANEGLLRDPLKVYKSNPVIPGDVGILGGASNQDITILTMRDLDTPSVKKTSVKKNET